MYQKAADCVHSELQYQLHSLVNVVQVGSNSLHEAFIAPHVNLNSMDLSLGDASPEGGSLAEEWI